MEHSQLTAYVELWVADWILTHLHSLECSDTMDVCVLLAVVSSISQPAHIVYSSVVHKSDFAKMKHVKCSWCFGGCLKWRAIPLHIART